LLIKTRYHDFKHVKQERHKMLHILSISRCFCNPIALGGLCL